MQMRIKILSMRFNKPLGMLYKNYLQSQDHVRLVWTAEEALEVVGNPVKKIQINLVRIARSSKTKLKPINIHE